MLGIGRSAARRRVRRGRRSIVALERLEVRTVLSTIVWNSAAAPAGGAWASPGNWIGGVVPGPGDDAVIDLTSPGAVTVSADASARSISTDADATLTLTAGTLALAADSDLAGGFRQTGGTLTGAGVLTVSGATTWTNGTQSGSGATVALGGMTLGTGFRTYLDQRTLVNAGGATFASGTSYETLTLTAGARIENRAGATFTFVNSTFINAPAGPGGAPTTALFVNQGTLEAAVPAGTSAVIGVPIESSGVVRAGSGTLSFRNGGAFTGAASLSALAGTKLEFYGAYASEAGTSISGAGTIDSRSGTFAHAGAYAVTGATTIAGGTLQLSGAVTSAGPVTISTGTLDLGTSEVAIPSLVQTGGTLTGTGVATITGATTWSAGVQSGSGSTVAAGGLTLGLVTSGRSPTLLGRTLINLAGAELTADGQNSGLTLTAGGTIVNQAGATFTFLTDGMVRDGGGAGGFVNHGTLAKAGGTANSSFISAPLSGDGAFRADAGRFDLLGGGSFGGAATLSVAAGATLWFRAGTFTAGVGTTISGAGLVEFSATSFVHSGTYDVSGTTRTSGGSTELAGPIASPGATVAVAGGTLRLGGPVSATNWDLAVTSGTFRADVDLTLGSLVQGGGVLTGASAVTVVGPIAWSGGNQTGTGSTLALGGMTITGGAHGLSQRTLDNAGVASLIGSEAYLGIGSGGTFVNRAGAEFRFDGDGTVNVSGANSFLNHGTVAKVSGTGTATLFADVQSDGLVTSRSGTLRIGETRLLGAGAVEAAGGATVAFYRVLGGAGSTILGAGTVRFMDGASSFGGAYDVTGVTEMVGGGASLTGTILSLGSLKVSGGDLNLSATTINLYAPSLLISGGRLLGSSYLNVMDDLTWTGGILAMGGAGSITSHGVMTLGSPASTVPLALTGMLRNVGTATLSAAAGGGLALSGVLENSTPGTFRILTGAVISGATPQGRFSNGGVLIKEGGGSVAVTSQFWNSGEVRVDAGTLSLGKLDGLQPNGRLYQGSYVVAGELIVPGAGIVAIDAPASITLVGPGASITDSAGLDALRNLAEIGSPFAAAGGGALTLRGRATASISGALVNRGALAIGPGSVLSIASNYDQRATGVFITELSGSEVGLLDVSGAAALDGEFRARMVGGTLAGGTRLALEAAGRIGTFASFTTEAPAWAELGLAYDGASVLVTVDVEPVLLSIAVTPTSTSLAAGLSTQFTATGLYSDGSTADLTSLATWASSSGSIADVSDVPGSRGLAKGWEEGAATISASIDGVAGAAVLIVTPAELISLALATTSTRVVVGGSQSFGAIGRYTDGTYRDLTGSVSWSTSDPSIATVDATGSATGLAVGTTTIAATLGAFSASSPLDVQTTATAVAIGWGAVGRAPLASPDGVRLLPAGRSQTIGWIGLDRITIELEHPAVLTAADVSVYGIAGGDYGPVTVTGSGTSYVIVLARPITQADRVQLTISSAHIASYFRRLDVLPGDVNDDGLVTIQDAILVRNRFAGIGPIVLPIEWFDVLGEGAATRDGYDAVRARIGIVLP